MKSRLANTLLLSIAAAFTLVAPTAHAQQPSRVEALQQQKREAWEKQQKELHEYFKEYLPDVQSSVTGYFNTLNIRSDQMKKGLTIPWVSTNTKTNWTGNPIYLSTHGFAVATGTTSATNKCPEFKVVAFSSPGKLTHRTEAVYGICP